jgi:hypothetical protein
MKKLAFCLLFAASFNAFGHNATEQLKKCTLEQNALKRLACFDAVTQNLTPTTSEQVPSKQPKAAVVKQPKQSVEASLAKVSKKITKDAVEPPKHSNETSIEPAKQPLAKASPVEEFGFRKKTEVKKLPDSIVANVKAIRKNPFKKYIITLDNGHVWKQFDSTRLRISVGETVTIKSGILGAFFMSKEGVSKRLRVKRVK